MTEYVLSKSKTGKVPRTGNRYIGDYVTLDAIDKRGVRYEERVFVLSGYRIRNGAEQHNVVTFNSQAAAKRAGWTSL